MITAVIWLYAAWQLHWFVGVSAETTPTHVGTIYVRWVGLACMIAGCVLATIVVNR